MKNGGSFPCYVNVYQRVHNSLENFSSRTCQFMCWGQVTKFLGLWTKFFSAEHIRLILNMESIIYSIVDFMCISLGFYVDFMVGTKTLFLASSRKKSTNWSIGSCERTTFRSQLRLFETLSGPLLAQQQGIGCHVPSEPLVKHNGR